MKILIALLLLIGTALAEERGNAPGDNISANATYATTTGPFSFAFWYNATVAPANATPKGISGLLNQGNFSFNWNHSNASFRQSCEGVTSAGSGYYGVTSTTTFSTGTWYHIACVMTSVGSGNCTMTVYVNGVSQATSASHNCTGMLSGSENITADPYGGSGSSLMRNFAFWHGTLSLGEVNAMFNGVSPSLIQTGNLVIFMPLLGLTVEPAPVGTYTHGTVKAGSPTAILGGSAGPWAGAQW